MEYNPKGEVVTATLGTCFVAATRRLTKEKKLRVGEHMSESLCALILVENRFYVLLERERYVDARSHLHGKCFYVLFRLHDLSTCLSRLPFRGNSLPHAHLYLGASCTSRLCCNNLQKRENCIPHVKQV